VAAKKLSSLQSVSMNQHAMPSGPTEPNARHDVGPAARQSEMREQRWKQQLVDPIFLRIDERDQIFPDHCIARFYLFHYIGELRFARQRQRRRERASYSRRGSLERTPRIWYFPP
jgi:hypothetical protein